MGEFAACLAEELGSSGGSAIGSAALAGNGAGARGGRIAYEDTEVGRLPVGPAGDAALAAGAPAPRERRSAEVLDLGAASRAAVAKRAIPALAAAGLAAAAVVAWLRRRA
jgi:hypothetical protein